MKGNGCQKCANYSRIQSLKLDKKIYIERATRVHGNKYDYSSIDYKNMDTNIKIKCYLHGFFNKNPYQLLVGSGCPKCQYCPKCQIWATNGRICRYCKPKNENKLYQKTKEIEVVKYLKNNLPDIDFIHNKSVGIDCTNGHYFPDIRFDCLFYQLVIEIDEHKHRGSSYECDKQRMFDVTAKLGQPCIFIRYNPDSKESNKDILLEKIKYYIEFTGNKDDIDKTDFLYKDLDIDENSGLKVEYLFY